MLATLNAPPGQIFNYVELLLEFLRIVHREWVEKHGPIYRGWGGSRSVVCISSPELMEVDLIFFFFKSLLE